MGEKSRGRHNTSRRISLKQRLEELETIHAISELSTSQLDFNALVEQVGEKIRATFGVQSVYIAFLDTKANLVHVPYYVIHDKRVWERDLSPTEGLTSHILRTRAPLLINEDYMRVSGEMGAVRVASPIPGEITQSWLGVPILREGQAIGAIGIVNYEREHAFSKDTVRFLLTIAATIASEFRNVQLVRDLQSELAERMRWEQSLLTLNQELSSRLAEIQLLQNQLRELSVRDALTNLFNRRYLVETLEREIARAARDQDPLSVVMMDIDNFKRLNDTYGHKAGDVVLERMGQLLLAHTRRGDVACRYGGEEFILVLPDASLGNAAERAEEVRRTTQAQRVPCGETELKFTLSFGVAGFPAHGDTGEKIIARADAMLYAAKNMTRNCGMVAPV